MQALTLQKQEPDLTDSSIVFQIYRDLQHGLRKRYPTLYKVENIYREYIAPVMLPGRHQPGG